MLTTCLTLYAMNQSLHRRVVPETYVQLLYEYLEARGYEPEEALGAPWPSHDGQAPSGVDVGLWADMLQRAKDLLADPLIGLHLGQTITLRHLGVLGPVLASCGTLATALQKLERYQRLVFDVAQMSTRICKDAVELVWDSRSEIHPGGLVNEAGFTVLVQISRMLTRHEVIPLTIEFAHTCTNGAQPYEDFFGCPVLFDRPEALVRFKVESLSAPLKSPDTALLQVLEIHADRILAQLPQQQEIVENVRREITRALHDGEPDIQSISKKLNCSSRTLQRRLRQADTNFRTELNVVRHELAVSYMRDPRLQIVDVALLLGYSEHSAFTRAFREWTGRSPQETREQLGN